LAEIDELRRMTSKDLTSGVELAALIRTEQQARGLDALELLEHLAETAGYAAPWIAATVVPSGGDLAPVLEVRRESAAGIESLAYAGNDPNALRTLPFGEVLAVSQAASGEDIVPLVLVGHPPDDGGLALLLHNQDGSVASGRVVVIAPSSDGLRRIDLGSLVMPAHTVWMLDLSPDDADPVLRWPGTGLAVDGAPQPTVTDVALPPFRLIGAAQDFEMGAARAADGLGNISRPNRYGNGVSYLFNRPPDPTEAENAANYGVRASFTGEELDGTAFSAVHDISAEAAWVQPSGRVVNVRYSSPLSALLDNDEQPLVQLTNLLDTSALVDMSGSSLDPSVPDPQIESSPRHYGGLVTGRVVRGTGEGFAGATVELVRSRGKLSLLGNNVVLDLVATTTTDATGSFFFDFVEEPHWDSQVLPGYTLRATVPAGADPLLEPAAVEEVGSIIRTQNRVARVNIALLGRGSIRGYLTWADTGLPVEDGTVSAANVLFGEMKTASCDAGDGSFIIGGQPVGPITLTGKDAAGHRVYATVGIEQPGAIVDVELKLPRTRPLGEGTVEGTVFRQPASGERQPHSGARVAVYSKGQPVAETTSDSLGRFAVRNVPEGQVTVQAADWRVSRTAALTDVMLAAGDTVQVELTLSSSEPRTVAGSVYFHDPVTNADLPIEGAVAFIKGPGVYAYSDANGVYRIENVPVQGVTDSGYEVTVIDTERKQQGETTLPPILDASPIEIVAQPIVLREMRGGIDGVVLDPLGRPMGGVGVVLYPFAETTSSADGTFSFDNVPIDEWDLYAHVGDGLQPGHVGHLGSATTRVVFGGHRPFVSIHLQGSGVVEVVTRTVSSSGVPTPLYYRPTVFSTAEQLIIQKGAYIETATDETGHIDLELPVGRVELTAANPFYGLKTVGTSIDYPGQVRHVEIVFEQSRTVTGQVLDVDGVTPVAGAEVTLKTGTLAPQTQIADGQGGFRFELVPPGSVQVAAFSDAGTVERVGVAIGRVDSPGQVLDLTVRMKAQGTATGCVVDETGGEPVPLAAAQYYLRENSFPNRRLPSGTAWYTTDGLGCYQVSHIYAGGVTVVARDPAHLDRQGSAGGTIASDWEVIELPQIHISTAFGSVGITVTDPDTGLAVPDAQVKLSNGEARVTDSEGTTGFEALPLGGYTITAFDAPTGRSARSSFSLGQNGQHREVSLVLDRRGEVHGALFDDPAKTLTVGGAAVELNGSTSGGYLRALSTTGSGADDLGLFSFLGIPEGQFDLTAAPLDSPRRAHALAAVTDTSPVAQVDMVLESVDTVYFRLYEKLTSGTVPVDPSSGTFSISLTQDCTSYGCAYGFTRVDPDPVTGAWIFPSVLVERSGHATAQELGGEQRRARLSLPNLTHPIAGHGSGTESDPYQLVLGAKGVVTVHVHDADGQPISGASVQVNAPGATFPSVTGGDGAVTFYAVPAGSISATATAPGGGTAGVARATLTYDDQTLDMVIALAPAVSAHGVIREPAPDDVFVPDPSTLPPKEGAIVQLTDASGGVQIITTGEDGSYHFSALPIGTCTVTAQDTSGEQYASMSSALIGPNGFDNPLPDLVLDASPPRLLDILPAPGATDVSRTAAVQITFSERLLAAVLPTGGPTSPYFALRDAQQNLAPGAWSATIDSAGHQIITFTPSQPYANQALYGLTIVGGPGGIRDRVGRLLTQSGNVGSTFRTSDSVGPTVVGTSPTLERPVEPPGVVRIDFNEAVQPVDGTLDTEVVLEWGQDDGMGGIDWQPYPATLSSTRSGLSVLVQPDAGLTLTDDSLKRRLTVSDLEDTRHNAMQGSWTGQYRIWDENPPEITGVPCPAGTVCTDLHPGTAYVLVPVLAGLDDVSIDNPGGDIDRVDYYLSDPDIGGQPVAAAQQYPFAYSLVALYQGDGTNPWPLDVWVRAIDTSTNESNTAHVAMLVLPNQPPTVTGVTAAALSPVPGTLYAGSYVRVTASGVDDPDSARLTMVAEMWRPGDASPMSTSTTRTVNRPGSGNWTDLAPQQFDFTVPLTEPEGSTLMFRVHATDPSGASVAVDSQVIPVADDQAAPAIESVVVRSASSGEMRTEVHFNDQVSVEVRVRDQETAVQDVQIAFDGVLPSPQAATPVAGVTNLWRTAVLTVPVGSPEDPPITVTTTATAHDYGSNEGSSTTTFEVSPEPDPTAPAVKLLTPWEGAPWPAAWTSTHNPEGTDLLVRVRVADTSVDGDGNAIPGEIASVEVTCPVRDGDAVVLSQTATPATLVSGTDGPGTGDYQVVCRVPNGIAIATSVPFEARAFDTGGQSTSHLVHLATVSWRRVFEAVPAASVAGDDPLVGTGGDPDGVVFLLDGSTVSLSPPENGQSRTLEGLALYTGGESDGGTALTVHPSVLTAPEVTSIDSSILYYPLELTIGHTLAVGSESRVSMDGKGLHGSSGEQFVALPGERASSVEAGGSHGGAGWYGSSSVLWDHTDLHLPGSTYDSLRDPSLPGAGGGGYGPGVFGGQGGGAIRLIGPGATFHVAGRLTANGLIGDYGYTHGGGGGAGGTVRLVAARLEGPGSISADGGTGRNFAVAGGGGGGRIALSIGEIIGLDPSVQISARGGWSEVDDQQRFGGAGTVFVELLDPANGDPLDDGALALANPTGSPAAVSPLPSLGDASIVDADPVTGVLTLEAPNSNGDLAGETLVVEPGNGDPTLLWRITECTTVLGASPRQVQLAVDASEDDLASLAALIGGGVVSAHGRSRFASLTAAGNTRLVTEDDLEILPTGDTTPIQNDRAALTLTDGARALLRGEAPNLSATPSVAAGGELRVGQAVTLSWSANDPLGLRWTTGDWTPDTPTTNVFTDERLSATTSGLSLQVPVNQPPGPISYVATARDLAERVSALELTWTVLANEPPTATLALVDGAPVVLPAGGSTTVVVHAEDLEGLASVELLATGPATAPSQLVSTSGTSRDLSFTVTALPDATGDVPVVLQAVVTDIAGLSVTTAPLELPVTPDTTPPVPTIGLSPLMPGDTYTGGDLITLDASATDDVGVTSMSIGVDGQTWSGTSGSLQAQWTAPAVTELTTYTITVEAMDAAGNVGTATRDVTVEPNDNASAPTAEILCPSEGALLPAGWDELSITAEATDDEGVAKIEFYLGTETTPFATATPTAGTPPTFSPSVTAPPLPTDVDGGLEVQYRVRAFDAANNHRDAFTTITVVPTVDLDPVEAYNDWSALTDQMVVLRSGTLTLTAPRTVGGLIVLPGAKITHPSATPSVPRAADLSVGGSVYLACGASIDASGRGYAEDTTHPDATPPGQYAGGSHLGYGGGSAGSTYGSITKPLEAGGGGDFYDSYTDVHGRPGGGVIRLLVGGGLQCDGAIRANGSAAIDQTSGAGGSIWLTVAGDVSGQGEIEARGGSTPSSYTTSGGGGAIAVEYGGTLTLPVSSLNATGGAPYNVGGAGTVLVKGPDSNLGDLIVDNRGADGKATVLPGLGSGIAQVGTSGATIVSDRASIPAYFVGHWVEVTDPDGSTNGIWQVVEVDGSTLTLADGATVAEGDSWQGVYRFDRVTIRGSGRLSSSDPIRSATASFEGGSGGDGAAVYSDLAVSGLLEVSGPIRARRLAAGSLTVHSGGTLSHPSTSSLSESLNITVTGNVTVEDGGSISVSGRGYAEDTTYPTATPPGQYAGGSHLGYGGGAAGSTFGSTTLPQEAGGGGDFYDTYTDVHGRPGGGIIRLVVNGSLQCDGAIRANGSAAIDQTSGAGGSVWLTVAGNVSGLGTIEARGGSAPSSYNASGGGGAIALEYGGAFTLPASSLNASGGTPYNVGGAGTVLLKGPDSTFGDLIVDNRGADGKATALPGIGSGTGQPGSSGVTLVTDKPSIPAYFVGHWVEVTDPEGSTKGIWQVVEVDSSTLTLADGATVAEGDTWAGFYRFDSLTVQGKAKLILNDADDIGTITVAADSTLQHLNRWAPSIDPSKVSITVSSGAYWVSGAEGAVTDVDGISGATVTDLASSQSWSLSVAADGSFPAVQVAGTGGDQVQIEATDAGSPHRTSQVFVGTLPANPDVPTIDGGAITYSIDVGRQYHLNGTSGAVSDSDLPLSVTATNDATLLTYTTVAESDGSFDVAIAGTPGDTFTLAATDSHPSPATDTIQLGAMPDLADPVLDPQAVSFQVHNRSFWVVGAAGAVADDGVLATVEIVDPPTAIAFAADGSFPETPIAAPTGAQLTLRATDSAGNSAEVLLPELPANEGSPTFNLDNLATESTETYTVRGHGICGIWGTDDGGASASDSPPCEAYPVTSTDGALLRLENRTTPGFGPWEPLVQVSADGQLYGWETQTIAGAIGDQIWLVAEDGHPDWLAAEVQVWALPQIPDAPTVTLGQANLSSQGDRYNLTAGAGAITGDPGPLQLVAHVWHDVAGQWQHVDDAGTSLTSGDPIDLALPAAALPGDLVVVEVTDSATTPRTTGIRVGYLPRPVVTFTSATATVDESAGGVTLTVQLSFAPVTETSVQVSTADGTAVEGQDYQPLATSVTFAPGQTSKTVDVTIIDDVDPEAGETFTVSLVNPLSCVLGTPKTVTVTIPANDAPITTVQMAVAATARDEFVGSVGINVALSAPSGEPVAVDWGTVPGSAAEGDDFEPASGTVVFDPGQISRNVLVTILDDTEQEPDETFSVVLSNPVGAVLGSQDTTVITILANDSSPTINTTGLALSSTGCGFDLHAGPGTVTTPDGREFEVWATVDNLDPAPDWQSARLYLSSGDPFDLSLSSLEPGATVTLHAEHYVSKLAVSEVVAVYQATPPTVDTTGVGETWQGDTSTTLVTIPSSAITNQVGPVTATLLNLTSGDSIQLTGTICPGGPDRSATIAAAASDELALELCHGTAVQVCTVPPVELGTGAFQLVDLAGAAITGLWRSGPTVLVGTDADVGRVISLDDPRHPVVLPWQVPLPYASPSGVIGRGPTTIVYADGSHLMLWSSTTGVIGDLEPLGSGVGIERVLTHGSDVVLVGRNATSIVAAVVSVDLGPSATLCQSSAAVDLPSTEGLTPLAVFALPLARFGVLTDDSTIPVRVVAMSGPTAFEPDTHPNLESFSGSPLAAWVDDDWLMVLGADDRLFHFRLPVPGLDMSDWWGVRGIPPARDSTNLQAGGVPTSAVRCGDYAPVLGYDNGTVDLYDFGALTRLTPPGGAVLSLVESYGVLLVATPVGVYRSAYEPLAQQAEVHATELRWEDRTLHVAPGGLAHGDGEILRFQGEDDQATPVTYEVEADQPPWTRFDFTLPATLDGYSGAITWYDWIELDGDGHDFCDPFDSQFPIEGPPFPDPECQLVAPACGADLVAAGAGWRAWATTGSDEVLYRWTDGTDWFLGAIDATNVRHLTAWGSDRLIVSGDVLTLIDLTDLSAPTTAPIDIYSGTEGLALAVGSYLLVAADGPTDIAVVDVSDPATPTLATAPMTVLGGTATVVDLKLSARGNPIVLARDGHAVGELDASALPAIVELRAIGLAMGGAPLAMDDALLDYPPAGGTIDGLWVLGADDWLHFYNLDDPGLQLMREFWPSSNAKKLLAYSDQSGRPRVLVAAGREGGLYDVWYDAPSGEWRWAWVADLGDARALALATPAFRAGQAAPETCAEIPHEATISSTVGCPDASRLFALTDLGPLPVPIDLCPPRP